MNRALVATTTLALVALAACQAPPQTKPGDTIYLRDGTTVHPCYVRDEGVRLTYWKHMDEVGGPPHVLPRDEIVRFQLGRGPEWDAQPGLPDLTVTHIEINPKLPSLHGNVQYDKYGRPWIGGPSEKLRVLGPNRYTRPQQVVSNIDLRYEVGQELTLTAHVKNVGFKTAQPFAVEWRIDGKTVRNDVYAEALPEMDVAIFTLKWPWQDGRHTVTLKVLSDEPEIATINNTATDPLWAFPLVFVVSQGRVDAWHEFRSAYGTFCWEDFYRWHLDIMNLLLARAVYPATPDGCHARVRLDRIIYRDVVPEDEAGDLIHELLVRDDGLRYDQGCWLWRENAQELETGQYIQTDYEWRNHTEWSLPHELGHQLGLVDWYQLDYRGDPEHTWPDTGERVVHLMRHPRQMMHWHGPWPFGEVDAAYLNATIDQPRGYFGDVYFGIPAHNFLRVVDINGQGVPHAAVEIFQRGTVVEPNPRSRGEMVTYYEVIESGDFSHPLSTHPVITSQTDEHGMVRLPDRPAEAVRTLNGFHRRPNPFGNINVVGERGLMLARITQDDRSCWYWLSAHDFVLGWLRGFRGMFILTLPTPFGSADSPPAPRNVQVERVDADHVRVSWKAADTADQNYLERLIGYRVYQRTGNDGMRTRPWQPIATVESDQRAVLVELRAQPQDLQYLQPARQRFGVTSIATGSVESTLAETVLREPDDRPKQSFYDLYQR